MSIVIDFRVDFGSLLGRSLNTILRFSVTLLLWSSETEVTRGDENKTVQEPSDVLRAQGVTFNN